MLNGFHEAQFPYIECFPSDTEPNVKLLQRRIQYEAERYNDIIQGTFYDTYRNLTKKALTSLRSVTSLRSILSQLRRKNPNPNLHLCHIQLILVRKRYSWLCLTEWCRCPVNSWVCHIVAVTVWSYLLSSHSSKIWLPYGSPRSHTVVLIMIALMLFSWKIQ